MIILLIYMNICFRRGSTKWNIEGILIRFDILQAEPVDIVFEYMSGGSAELARYLFFCLFPLLSCRTSFHKKAKKSKPTPRKMNLATAGRVLVRAT